MNGSSALRIFIPRQCLNERSGLLFGHHQHGSIIIAGLIPYRKNEALDVNYYQYRMKGFQILGEWDNEFITSESIPNSNEIPYDEFLFCLRNVDADYPVCRLVLNGRNTYGTNDPIVVLYDTRCITNSVYLVEKDTDNSESLTNLNLLHKTLKKLKNIVPFIPQDVMTFMDRPSDIDRISQWICKQLVLVVSYFIHVVQLICSNSIVNNQLTRSVFFLPAVTNQIHKRFLDLAQLDGGQKKTLCRGNVLLRHALDVCLGLAVMMWFIQGDYASMLADLLMAWAEVVAGELQRLLTWLMGVPAGLKLNSQLDRFLGRFFMYHIYLWTGYLRFMSPVLSSALWYISLSGCVGLSAQLALVQDLLSMMTLHIYCFYVYAARLYRLQMYALSSLWRLFRGKKWNVLRTRVDSASYDVDQLFIGTLLFTVLLFLLPTTLLYYVVFALLRLFVLAVQGVLYETVAFINNLPLYIIFLRFFKAEVLASEAQFHVLKRNFTRPLYLVMELHPPALGELFSHGQPPAGRVTYTWGTFWGRVLAGQLVYPWIDHDS